MSEGSEPSMSERKALAESGPLLRFASENVRDLDPAWTRAIAEARIAAEQNRWQPQIAEQFWKAFNGLCQSIQPATMDSISAKQNNISVWRWFPPRKKETSLAARTSGRYLVVLFCLIGITVPLQLYAWLYSIESKRSDDLVTELRSTANATNEAYQTLYEETPNGTGGQFDADQIKEAKAIIQQAKRWNSDIDRLTYYVAALERLSLKRAPTSGSMAATISPQDQWYQLFAKVNERSNGEILQALNAEATAGLIAGVILSFLLPILFGMIGAVTFVIRTMSDQIKSSTFSTTSPIRHLMRVTLGALAGVVVGLFSNLSSQVTLPPLAIAFLAGYGVEALFSMSDGFIAKFRAT